MASERFNAVYNEDYADFFIEYYGMEANLDKYREYDIEIINYFLAVVHTPVSEMTYDIMSQKGYHAIPSLYGLTSVTSLEASGIIRVRNIPKFNLRGKGVLIGIADSGIDYTNSIFQYADKTTKIAAIWDQTVINDQTKEDIEYGTEYSREQINKALQSEDPYQVVPTKDEVGHGTIVAGIAAGNEVPEQGFYGVAPDADLVIVKLKPAKKYLKEFYLVPESSICYQENDLLFGFQYLLNYAVKVNRPIVICVSCETSQGAHDGRDIISSWFNLQSSYSGTSIIIPVGNEGNTRRHFYGTIEEEPGFELLELNVGPEEEGFSMEIWGASPNIISIDILSPSGEYIPKLNIKFNETTMISFIFEATIIYIHYEIVEAQSGDQLIHLRFLKPAKGIWTLKVYGRGIFPMIFNAWLPMNGFITTDTFFLHSDPAITLLTSSCAELPITITAYNMEEDTLYSEAGRGYTRIGTVKPDLASPGVNIVSPTLDQGFSLVSGTSAAAAHTAGVAALLFEWGIVNGNYPQMRTQDMKIFMIRGARRKPELQYPNRDWGYGILDVYQVFDSLRRSI